MGAPCFFRVRPETAVVSGGLLVEAQNLQRQQELLQRRPVLLGPGALLYAIEELGGRDHGDPDLADLQPLEPL